MKATNPLKVYKETQIKTANQGKLIIMLYEGAIKNLNLALESLKAKHQKFDYVSNCIMKTQDILAELMVSLNLNKGGEIARNLFSLYIFMNRQLLSANLKKESKPLEEVKRMLTELRDAWKEIAGKTDVETDSAGDTGVNIAG